MLDSREICGISETEGSRVGFKNSKEKKNIPAMPEFQESFCGIPFHILASPPKKNFLHVK